MDFNKSLAVFTVFIPSDRLWHRHLPTGLQSGDVLPNVLRRYWLNGKLLVDDEDISMELLVPHDPWLHTGCFAGCFCGPLLSMWSVAKIFQPHLVI